ncbi:MAG: hypothetical protein U0414_32080 [Polyangiaceae bacterium]
MAIVSRAPSSGDVVVVDPRVLRRVIKRHRRLPGVGLDVPHASSYALPKDALLGIVGVEDLGRDVSALPGTVILVPRAEDDAAGSTADLRRRWRSVFHARIHVALEQKLGTGTLTTAAIRERIHRLGQCEFDEARATLRQARRLVDPRDDRETWAEFAATYVEHRTFAPALVLRMFPTLGDLERVDALVAEDVDARALLESARPAGAPDAIAAPSADVPAPPSARVPPVPAVLDRAARDALIDRAGRAARRGNHVRAALSYLGAASAEGPDEAAAARRVEAARAEIDALAAALDRALGTVTDARARAAWTDALLELARRAVRGTRAETSVEARALFDVQNACRDADRTPKTVELVAFLRSLGKKPIVRSLPAAREIRVARRLRSAEIRAGRARLPGPERRAIAEIFHGVRLRAGAAFRAALRPRVHEALLDVGLSPRNAVERAALRTIVEKLLDGAATRGFFGIGQLRDAISESALKLPNLDLGALVRGDALLRADRRLGGVIDGVYREGEIYLRFLQRVSALAFATRVGRAFTLHVALPFGAAFIGLEGIGHAVHAIGSRLGLPEVHVVTPITLAVTGYVLYLLLHVRAARGVARRTASAVASGAYVVLVKGPARLATAIGLVRLLKSRAFRLAARFVLVPGAVAAGAWLLASRLLAGEIVTRIGITTVVFAGVNILTNSRIGLLAEEVALDWIARRLRWLQHHFIPGLFRTIIDFFALVLELVERGLYAVDEFFRFREGENRVALAAKVVLGFVWFFVAYVIRLYTNLLIEPQVNPIKHFPVVTVSHKMVLPLLDSMMAAGNAQLAPALGAAGAKAIVTPTVVLIPGVFGFIAWELKENFRLYAQNRSTDLGPVRIGLHGETMAGLLCPGFHSGTVPKLYAKLRRATLKGDGSAGKYEDALNEVRDAIARFVERELVALLEESRAWKFGALRLDAVDVAASRIRVALKRAGSPAPLVVSFEEQSGWLVGGVTDSGFAEELGEEGRLVLENLLAGLYRLAACDLVRELIEPAIGGAAYDIADEGLVVWPGPGYRSEVVYSLSTVGLVTPTSRGEPLEAIPPALDTRLLLLREQPLPFGAWCDAWERASPRRLETGPSLLPTRSA